MLPFAAWSLSSFSFMMHFFLRVSTFNRPFSSVSLSFHPAWLQACNPRSRVENKSYDSEKRNVSRNIAFLCFTFVGLQTEVECGVCCRGHGQKPGLRGDGKRAWRRALCRQLCRWRPAGGRERGEGKRRSESSACPHAFWRECICHTSCMIVLAHRRSPWSSTLGRSLSPCSRTGSPPPPPRSTTCVCGGKARGVS